MTIYWKPRKNGRTYYYDFWLDGRRHHARVGPSKTDAENAERVERGRALEHRLEVEWNIRKARRTSPTVRVFFGLWVTDCQTTYPTTWKNARSALKPFVALHGDRRLTELTSKEVEAYKTARQGAVNPNSVRNNLAWVRRFFDLAVRQHLLSVNPARQVRSPKAQRRHYHIPDAVEKARLLSKIAHPTMRDMVELTMLLGLRRGEVLTLLRSDVNFDTGILAVLQPKTRTYKYLALTEPVLAILQRHVTTSTPGDRPVFVSQHGRAYAWSTFWGYYRAARIAAGLPRVRPHDLRHAFGTDLANDGATLADIGALMGHAPPYTTTLIYVSHTNAGRTRKALERLHGRDLPK